MNHFGDRHLGVHASALVDGELDPPARDRALSHLARCAACRDAVEAERRAKWWLAGAAATTPTPTTDLTARLLDLAEPGEPLPPRLPRMPGGAGGTSPLGRPGGPGWAGGPWGASPPPGYAAPSGPGRRRPRLGRRRRGGGAARTRTHRGPRRTALVASTAVAFSGLVLGGAFALGGAPTTATPSVRIPVDRYAVQHASTRGRLPLSEPGLGAVQMPSSWMTGMPPRRSPARPAGVAPAGTRP